MSTLPIPITQPLVVFTDLDGTLIDHYSYGVEGSQNALQQLAARKAALVFCSSKTFAEQLYLQQQLGIKQPFIFENGSAIAIPTGFFSANRYKAAGREAGYDLVVFAHAEISELYATLSLFPKAKGYASASDIALAAATSLNGDALGRARERRYTETLLAPQDENEAVLLNKGLKGTGFSLSRGGRFYTMQSEEIDKGKATKWMMEIFRQENTQTPCFAATGDSLNDVPMLEVVDFPFLVQRPDQSWANIEIPNLIMIKGIGPAGFSAAVKRLIEG